MKARHDALRSATHDVMEGRANALTQRAPAQPLDVNESQVSRDERNEYYGITIERAQRILDALRTEVVTRVVEPTEERESEVASV